MLYNFAYMVAAEAGLVTVKEAVKVVHRLHGIATDSGSIFGVLHGEDSTSSSSMRIAWEPTQTAVTVTQKTHCNGAINP